MEPLFTRMALAAGFTPRLGALLKESSRLSRLWQAELLIIHAGDHQPELEKRLHEVMEQSGVDTDKTRIIWESGPPAKAILRVCKKENIDLLIAGALHREKVIQYYLGSVARRLLRNAPCSVLMLTDPATSPVGFKNVVVHADRDNPYMADTLHTACMLACSEQAAWLHVVRTLKWYAFLSASEEFSESEYEHTRNQLIQTEVDDVQRLLNTIPHPGVKVNIKLISGKSGHELAQFARRKHADLLVVSASPLKLSLLDRFMPNDLEYLFSDLPCNLLVVKPMKGGGW